MFNETGKIRILIADDNREFCGILKDYFSNDNDFDIVDVCMNGMDALEVLEKDEVDVLIWTSLCLMDGIGV